MLLATNNIMCVRGAVLPKAALIIRQWRGASRAQAGITRRSTFSILWTFYVWAFAAVAAAWLSWRRRHRMLVGRTGGLSADKTHFPATERLERRWRNIPSDVVGSVCSICYLRNEEKAEEERGTLS
jgi:hypothetical protein